MTILVLGVLGSGLVDPQTLVLRADDVGVDRGDGCFEGCHVRTDHTGTSRVDKLDAHLARMARSAAALQIPFDEGAWRALVAEALAAWREPGETSMKLVLTRGSGGEPTGLLTIRAFPEEYFALRRDGMRVVTVPRGTASDAFADAPWLLGGVKTLSYAVNMAAQREAARRGVDDVIFTSSDGYVLEAPRSTVVWAVGRTLTTTPLRGSGVLGGTTQQLLFERAAEAGWRTGEALARVDDLHAADAVWLTSSILGPVDVVELDGKGRARRPDLNAEVCRLTGF